MKNATNFRVQFKRNKEIYEKQLIEHVEDTHPVTLSNIEKLIDKACEKRQRYVEIGLDNETRDVFNVIMKFPEIVSYLRVKGFTIENKCIIKEGDRFWKRNYYVISY